MILIKTSDGKVFNAEDSMAFIVYSLKSYFLNKNDRLLFQDVMDPNFWGEHELVGTLIDYQIWIVQIIETKIYL